MATAARPGMHRALRPSRCARSLVVLLLAGCAGAVERGAAPAPVAVEGARADIGWLAGEWTGEFDGFGGRSRGTIAFTLDPRRDSATGFVAVSAPGGGSTILRFGRVVVAETSIAGWLESYADTELGCPVDTWFEGGLERDTLRGMFFAHPAAGDSVRRGTWWAARSGRGRPAGDRATR